MMFRPFVAACAAFAVVLAAGPASAQLTPGVTAPEFQVPAARGGAVSQFDLHAALAKGPVVLYFFPKAFTSGCTIEAHDFSSHIADYTKLGATVIGVSGDGIETQKKFSTQECRSNFLVGSDPSLAVAKSYDTTVLNMFANRTSYVIAPNGKIVYAYTSGDPSLHVANTLAALRKLRAPAGP
jgi:peroxiredoxin